MLLGFVFDCAVIPERKMKKKPITGGLMSPENLSSSSDDEFLGFEDEHPCSSNSKLFVTDEVQLCCYECDAVFPISALNMDRTTYYLTMSMADWGCRWHCSTCLREKRCPKPIQIEKQLEIMGSQIASMAIQLKTLADSQKKIPDAHDAEAKPQKGVSTLAVSKSIAPSTSLGFKPSMKSRRPDPISHQVLVIPKDNEEFTLQSFSDVARKNLPTIPIKKLGITKQGHGYIKVPDKEVCDKALNTLKTNYNVVAKNQSQREFLPKITISDLNSEDYTNDNKDALKEAILSKNPAIKSCVDDKKDFNILFVSQDKRTNTSKAVVKLHPDILRVIKLSKYKIYIDFSTCRVSDRFFLKQCYRCQKFGHRNEDCSMKVDNKHVCRFCSANHESSTCFLRKLAIPGFLHLSL